MTLKLKCLFTQALYSKWCSHGALALCLSGGLLGSDQSLGKSAQNPNQESVDDSVNPFDDADTAASASKGGPGTEGPSEVLQKNPFQGGAQDSTEIDPYQGQSLDYTESLGGKGGSPNKVKADFGEKDIEAAFSNKPKKVKSTQKKTKGTPKVKDTVAEKRLESQQKALAHEEAQKRRRLADQEKEAQEAQAAQEAQLAAAQSQALQESGAANGGVAYEGNSRNGSDGSAGQDQQGTLSQANSIKRGPGPGVVDEIGDARPTSDGPATAYGGPKTPNKNSGMTPEDFDRVPQWVSGQDALALDGRLRNDDLLNEDQSLTLLKGSSAGHDSGLRGGYGGSALAGRLGGNLNGDDDEADAPRLSPSEDGANLAQGLFGDPFGPSVEVADNQTLDDDLGQGAPRGTAGGFDSVTPGSDATGMGVLAQAVTRRGNSRLGLKAGEDRELGDKALSGKALAGKTLAGKALTGKAPAGKALYEQALHMRAVPPAYSLKLNQPKNSLRLLALQVPMVRDTMGRHLVITEGETLAKGTSGLAISLGGSRKEPGGGEAGVGGNFGQRSLWAKAEGADSWAFGIWIGIAIGLMGVGFTVLQRLSKGKTHRA